MSRAIDQIRRALEQENHDAVVHAVKYVYEQDDKNVEINPGQEKNYSLTNLMPGQLG